MSGWQWMFAWVAFYSAGYWWGVTSDLRREWWRRQKLAASGFEQEGTTQ